MLADFAVGGQRFGKHKHRGFRKLVLANVVRRQCGRRVFCDLLIVDADYFDISRHHHIFGGKCLQHANRQRIGCDDHRVGQIVRMILHQLTPLQTAVFHSERAVRIHQSLRIQSQAQRPIAECERTNIFRIFMLAHNVAQAANEADPRATRPHKRVDRIQYGLFQIRLYRIEQCRRRIDVDEYAVGELLMQAVKRLMI